MKKIFLLTCLFIMGAASAQVTYPEIPQEPEPEKQAVIDTIQKPEAEHVIQDYLRFYYIWPDGVGNNVLAKANDGKGGFGFGISGYFTKNIGIIVGIDITTYNITDVSRAVNGSRTIVTSPYIGGEYKLFLGKYVALAPSLSFTPSQMRQRDSEKKLGTYHGAGLRTALTLDFAIIPYIKIFAGANYSFIWYDVDTAPEYKNYYTKVGSLNIMAGIKVAF